MKRSRCNKKRMLMGSIFFRQQQILKDDYRVMRNKRIRDCKENVSLPWERSEKNLKLIFTDVKMFAYKIFEQGGEEFG